MKRKIFLSFILIAAIFMVGILSSCGGSKLENPHGMDIVNDYFVWDPVEGADGYLLYFTDEQKSEEESVRYFVKENKLSINEKEIFSSLKSGKSNYLYIRAVKLNDQRIPVSQSDRSLIIFDYSRQLATPNKVGYKNNKFSWRSVSEAQDYKALVRKADEKDGKLYDMEWQTGTTGISGVIKNLDDGFMYYVSIVATAEGYENSIPSVEVPYDRTVINVDDRGNEQPVDNKDSNVGKWPVTLNYNYNDAPDPSIVYVAHNKYMDTPTTPVRFGYKFDGWYEDQYCLIKAEFGAKMSLFKITAPTTFYAKWVLDNTDQPDQPGPDQPGPDQPGPDQPGPGPDQPGTTCTYHIDSDGDGYCDICGAKMPDTPVQDDTIGKIYLDPGKYDWFGNDNAEINVHIWYTDGTNNSWPGAKMTLNSDGLYEAEYYTSRTIKGIVFTRNSSEVNPAEGTKTEWDRIEIGEVDYFNNDTPVFKLKTYYHIGDSINFTGKWLAVGEEDKEDVIGDKKLYLDFRDVSWFMDSSPALFAYIWYKDGSSNAAYPGVDMTLSTKTADGKYYAASVLYDSTKEIGGIIFTRNNPALPVSGDGEGLWNKLEVSADEYPFSSDNPAFRILKMDGNFFEGVYENEGVLNDGGAPQHGGEEQEEQVIDEKTDAYLYLNPVNIDWFNDYNPFINVKVTYTDKSINGVRGLNTVSDGKTYKFGYNSEKQIQRIEVLRIAPDTGDLWNMFSIGVPSANEIADEKVMFTLFSISDSLSTGSWMTKTEEVEPTEGFDIYYFNDEWENVNLYAFGESSFENAAWPGKAMTAVEGKAGWYTLKIPTQATFVIFNNGSAQTDNILVDVNKTFYYQGEWHTEYPAVDPVEEKLTFYFSNTSNWDNVYAYAYTETNASTIFYTGTWPGKAMTPVANKPGWFSIAVDAHADKIIFNDGVGGTGRQTADLEIDENKLYYEDEWLTTFPAEDEEWDGTITVEINWEYFGTADAYLYVWYTDESNNHNWPGIKMTKQSDGTYKLDQAIDLTKTFAGLIVNRVNPEDATKVWNKSADITVIPSSHKIIVNNMVQAD